MKKDEFTFQHAYNVQLDNLVHWAKRLNTESYLLLLAAVIKRNSKVYKSPYDVCRGNDITNIVENLYRN